MMRGKNAVLSLLLSTLIFSISVNAKTVTVRSQIDAVTVYPQGATVTRTGQVQLTPGDHILVIDSLPSGLYQQSLRVMGQGQAGVLIGSVESKIIPGEVLAQAEEQRLKDEITTLEDKLATLNNAIESLDIRLTFIKSIGQNIPETINREIKSGTVNPKMWREAWESIGNGAAETYEKILAKKKSLRSVEAKRQKLVQQLAQIQTGSKSVVQARINITAQNSGVFTLRLSYQLAKATWVSVYDARLDVEKAKLMLKQYGQVRQRTGEDWSNVKLTLSTANPAQGVQMPDLESWFVRILRPRPLAVQGRLMEAPAEMNFAEEKIMAVKKAKAKAPARKRAKAKVAQANVSEFAAEYTVSGRSNIAADNAAQKFAIGEHNLTAKLAARVVPKRDSRAYLYADTIYTGTAPLMPGQVSVFRDNAFIGNSRMKLVRPSEKIKFSFGVDNRVKVDYRMVSDERSQAGIISKDKVVKRLYRVEITNHHAKSFDIVLLEHIPVSQDERIEVELSKQTTQPTQKDLHDRLGVMAWRYSYQPKEKKKITIGYELRYPKELNVQGF